MGLSAGSVVAGKYRIVRELGAGGMGTVYVATNLNLQRDEALKVMYERYQSNEEAGKRFLQEARAVAKLTHHGIVDVFDSGHDESGFWIAMELLPGESLGHRLTRGPLTESELRLYTAQLLDTLQFMHRSGIVHRDLKPDNIFLEQLPTGQVQTRILDFGIAKFADASVGMFATQADASLGTPHYMAPEQATQAKSVDHRADLYSLGVILYECLSGTLPYDASSFGDLIVKMHNQKPKALKVPSGLKRYLEAAVACLAVNPAQRPADCSAIAQMLRLPPPLPLTGGSSAPPQRLQKRPLLLGVAGGAAGLFAVLLLSMWWSRPAQESAPLAPLAAPRPPWSEPRDAFSALPGPDAQVAANANTAPAAEAPATPSLADAGEGPETEPVPAARTVPARKEPRAQLPAAPAEELAPPAPLTAAQLSDVVKANRAELQRCYERALRATGGKQAEPTRISVSVVVAAEGDASHVSTQGEGIGELTDCIDRAVTQWHFPRSPEGAQFAFPLVFAPGS